MSVVHATAETRDGQIAKILFIHSFIRLFQQHKQYTWSSI